ncbi:aminotransferase class V-fold PLP-dependent enzyme [Microbacterium jejuense]|uniref:Aminotransferase class V-fold PLP-dependent enzyme n=1 Tax=Microbacterium jejuense TaxID=1263637 RepID=A0ABS7HKA2_9MICO|nr:aminotransferase class V-fold PLP-dependent enzyme [Microbacterium jejuense]MBW9092711.1 aminotransferase class V-fold PLP-dependent enzyme [Microbacterium jejuense]
MVLDVDRARADTPGVRNVAHFNNAGSALPPRQVTEAVIDHLRLESERGGYEAAAAAEERIEATYDSVAALIGADRDEIAIVENATRAWDMVFYALAASFRPGDRILTSRAEYASNMIAFLQIAARSGVIVEAVDNDASGQISVDDLRDRLTARGVGPVRLIALTHVPTQGGLVNPAADVGRAAREFGVPYLLDACQSIGQMPIDVSTIGCDFLTATGRKFLRAPRGTGFAYVRRDLIRSLEPPFLDLHAATWTAADRFEIRPDARRFENWETNVAGKIGLGVAASYAQSWGLTEIQQRVQSLADTLRQRLRDRAGVRVHDQGERTCGIVTFTVDGTAPHEVQRRLAANGINTSVSVVDYARLDLEARHLTGLVRASVHYYNTDEEIDRLIAALP